MKDIQFLTELISDLNTKMKKVVSYNPHEIENLAGWIGLYTIVLQNEDNDLIDIDIRYAYGPEIFNQFLFNQINIEKLLLDQSKTYNKKHDKYIFYLCEKDIGLNKNKVVTEIPERFLITNHWRSITHLYLKIDNNLSLRAQIPMKYKKLRGYATTRLLNESKNKSNSTTNRIEGGLRTKGLIKKTYADKPIISIITTVYNNADYLEQTIQSVINQSYDNLEYIIIDGGSTDNTLDIIRKYDDKVDYWISEPDDGIYYGMDKGIRLSTGDYFAVLSSDDFYCSPQIINEVKNNIINFKEFDFFYADVYTLKSTDDKHIFKVVGDLKKMNLSNSINHPTLFMRTNVYKTIGGFDLNFKISADYELALRLIHEKHTGYKINKSLVCIRQGGCSFLNNIKLKEHFIIKKKYHIMNFFWISTSIRNIILKVLMKIIGIKHYNKLRSLRYKKNSSKNN